MTPDRSDVVTFEEKDRTTKPSNTKMLSIGERADSRDGFRSRVVPLVRQLEMTQAAAPNDIGSCGEAARHPKKLTESR